MGRFEERRPELEAAGARLAAISVDPIEKSEELIKDKGWKFPLLSDEIADTVSAYGVLHTEKRIALPSIFVIDSKKVIRWRYISHSVTDRPPEADVLVEVRKLQAKTIQNSKE